MERQHTLNQSTRRHNRHVDVFRLPWFQLEKNNQNLAECECVSACMHASKHAYVCVCSCVCVAWSRYILSACKYVSYGILNLFWTPTQTDRIMDLCKNQPLTIASFSTASPAVLLGQSPFIVTMAAIGWISKCHMVYIWLVSMPGFVQKNPFRIHKLFTNFFTKPGMMPAIWCGKAPWRYATLPHIR